MTKANKIKNIILSLGLLTLFFISTILFTACKEDGLTKAQYSEALNETSNVMNLEQTNTTIFNNNLFLQAQSDDENYRDLTGAGAQTEIESFRRMTKFLSSIFSRDDYKLSKEITTLKVINIDGYDHDANLKLKYEYKDNKIYIDFYVSFDEAYGFDSYSGHIYQYISYLIDYNFDSKQVNSYTLDSYLKFSEEASSMNEYSKIKYTKEDGTKILLKESSIYEESQTNFISKGQSLNSEKFSDTKYDFTNEYKSLFSA